ncbi:MAG: preprotein translocase subunit Sec61beta [Candidatus Odinarchaeota archaeon]
MSRRRKKSKSDSPMPATGAGLIRFYSESDSPGIKVGPVTTAVLAIGLIIIVAVMNIFSEQVLSLLGLG